jgi:hypothetical protein
MITITQEVVKMVEVEVMEMEEKVDPAYNEACDMMMIRK